MKKEEVIQQNQHIEMWMYTVISGEQCGVLGEKWPEMRKNSSRGRIVLGLETETEARRVSVYSGEAQTVTSFL